MELAFLSAVEQARLVRTARSRRPSSSSSPRADRAARSRAQLLRHRRAPTRRSQSAQPSTRRADDAPFRGVPIAIKDLAATAGIRTTYSSPRVRGLRPRLRHGGRAPHPRGRLRHRGQDEHAGVRHGRLHRVGTQRRDPEPVEHRPHAGRVEWRRRSRPRSRARPARARHRRRRLHSHPRVLLRALRAEAVSRPRLRARRSARSKGSRRPGR